MCVEGLPNMLIADICTAVIYRQDVVLGQLMAERKPAVDAVVDN